VIDEHRGDLDALVFHHEARTVELVNVDQRPERRPTFLAHADFEVDRVHVDEIVDHPRDAWWSIQVDRCMQPGGPGEEDEVAQVSVMV
jgi:hypothetical protein